MVTLRKAVNKENAVNFFAGKKESFFLTLETFDFARDVNGNTICKYEARLHCSDLESVKNNYTSSLIVLQSPRRREQCGSEYSEGQGTALDHLSKLGYTLKHVATQHFSTGRKYKMIYEVA